MLRRILNLIARIASFGGVEPQGAPLPPTIPPEALQLVKQHHNARCGAATPPEVTDPPLRGSLRDRMQRRGP